MNTVKRLLSLLCLLALLTGGVCAAAEDEIYLKLRLYPGDTFLYPDSITGAWESDDSDVVSVLGNQFTALEEGFACLTAEDEDGKTYRVEITVTTEENAPEDDVPPLIRAAIDFALKEWEDADGDTFARCNKYTLWYSNGHKYEYGWCAAFECYCLYHVGIPMVEWTACEPHEEGDAWGVKANGVGKVIEGYNKMNRLTFIPRTGYLVVYGQKDSGTCMHVGIITDVQELGDGKYLIKTVEGNMSNRIKRYCYIYDLKNANEEKANGKNNYKYIVKDNYYSPDEQYQTDPDTFQYTKHVKNWYVYRFCATWF